MIESRVLVPSIKPHDSFLEIGMSVTEFLMMCENHQVFVQSIMIAIGEVTTANVITGLGYVPSKEQPFEVINENSN